MCWSASDLSGEDGCDDPALLFFFSFFCFFDDEEDEEEDEEDEEGECKSVTDFVFANSEPSGFIVTSCVFFPEEMNVGFCQLHCTDDQNILQRKTKEKRGEGDR